MMKHIVAHLWGMLTHNVSRRFIVFQIRFRQSKWYRRIFRQRVVLEIPSSSAALWRE